jgi:hypothetical protein
VNWLCKIGLHSWEHLGFAGLMLDSTLKRCRRCGIGHMDVCYGQAYVRYTPEQVEQFLAMSKSVAGRDPSHRDSPRESEV